MFGLDKLIGEKLEKLEAELAKNGGGLTKVTRRDLFAAAAVHALILADGAPQRINRMYAVRAREIADAMLDELANTSYTQTKP